MFIEPLMLSSEKFCRKRVMDAKVIAGAFLKLDRIRPRV